MFWIYKISLLLIFVTGTNIFAQFVPSISRQYQPNYFKMLKEFEDWTLKYNQDEKSKGWKWYQRMLWEMQSQIYPNGNLPDINVYKNIFNDIQSQKIKKSEFLQEESGWIPVGPDLIAFNYDTVSGHGIGRVNCVAFHPTNPDIFWIGTPNGGIWKTENGAESWLPLTDNLQSLCITDIEVDQKNPDILYAATGDMETMGWITSSKAIGIYKSTDGGINWLPTGLSNISNEWDYSYIRNIIIHPDNSDDLIAAGSLGIWKSSDAGKNWVTILDTLLINDLVQSPDNPNVLFAASQWFYGLFSKTGIFKSTDFGLTWTELNTEIPADEIVTRSRIAVSPADPNYIYVLTVNRSTNGMYAIYRSTDGGDNWVISTDVNNIVNPLGWFEGDQSDRGGQGTYDLTLTCDPDDKEKIYIGGVNMWASEDGGKTCDIVSLWMNVFGPSLHADQHFAVYRDLDKSYYICNDGGIYRTKKIIPGKREWVAEWVDRRTENLKPGCPGFDFPTEWENLGDGLANTEFYKLGICRDFPGYVSGGSQDNGCFYNNNQKWFNYVTNYDGMETMINHTNPSIVYGASQNGRLCKSTDETKTQICNLTESITNNERGDWVTQFGMDGNNPDIIYAAYRNLWRSKDAGMNWEKFFNLDSISAVSRNINVLTIARKNPEVICLAKPSYSFSEDSIKSELWITYNGGESWKKCNNGLPIDSMQVRAIEINGDNPQEIWISFNTSYSELKLFKSEDGGESWINITNSFPNISVNSIQYQDGSESKILYLGTNYGVWYTYEGFNGWTPLVKNLPNNTVTELEIQYKSGKLYASTYGRGIWMTDLVQPSTDVKEYNFNSNIVVTISSNPNQGSFVLNISQSNDNTYIDYNLDIVDIFGRIVYTEPISANSKFEKQFNLNLSSGVYYLKISKNNQMHVEKLIISR